MPVKKAVKKAVKKVTEKPEPSLAEQLAAKAKESTLAWRKKRERVHKGLTNANVEDANA